MSEGNKIHRKGLSWREREAEQHWGTSPFRDITLHTDWWRGSPDGASGANGGFYRWPQFYEAITQNESCLWMSSNGMRRHSQL